jgi:hypothetical protein
MLAECTHSTPSQHKAKMKLDAIGWSGEGDAPSRTDWGLLPLDIDSLGYRQGGDITGAGTGAGAGVKQRKAQVSVRDIDTERAKRRARARAKIAKQSSEEYASELERAIESEESEARALERWARSLAQSAYRWVCNHKNLRGDWVTLAEHARPSQTSRDEAQAVALASIWQSLAAWRGRGCAEPSEQAGGALHRLYRDWQGCGSSNPLEFHEIRRDIARNAWQAARQSLTARGDGMTGRHAQDGAGEVETTPLLAPSQADLKSLEVAAQSGQLTSIAHSGSDSPRDLARVEARADCQRWVWFVLVKSWARHVAPEHAKSPAHVAKLKAARARARLVVRLIQGDTLTDAAAFAGFKSARAANESLRSGQVWESLQQAAESSGRAGVEVRKARESERLWRARARGAVLTHRGALLSALWLRAWARRERSLSLMRWRNARAVRIASERRQRLFWEDLANGWRKGFNR